MVGNQNGANKCRQPGSLFESVNGEEINIHLMAMGVGVSGADGLKGVTYAHVPVQVSECEVNVCLVDVFLPLNTLYVITGVGWGWGWALVPASPAASRSIIQLALVLSRLSTSIS